MGYLMIPKQKIRVFLAAAQVKTLFKGVFDGG